MIEYMKDDDRIVTLLINDPQKNANLLSPRFFQSLSQCLVRFMNDPDTKGIILSSGKSDFCSGADLEYILNQSTPSELSEILKLSHQTFRQLEKNSGKPVVSLIQGHCLGGGMELALATHYRLCLNQSRIKLGLPEVTLGLLPGAGGTQRLARLLPLQKALEILLEGRSFSPQEAQHLGLIHDLAETPEELLLKAKVWINQNPQKAQPWDQEQFKIPGGGVQSPQGAKVISVTTAMIQQKTQKNYPAPVSILNCVYQGLQVPFDRALDIEAKHFLYLLQTPQCQNMIRTLFFGIQACQKNSPGTSSKESTGIKTVGVLGAGMMGQGIAYVSARAGIKVILKDVKMEQAEKGKAYSKKLLEKELQKGKISKEKMEEILDRIESTDDPEKVKDCDLVIEAVIEDRLIKNKVYQESEKVLSSHAVIGSNTSTLPITGLAEGVKQPENFIGIHFFSPVEKMPLVEVISGEKTSSYAKQKAFEYIRQIQKTPIFVNDGRGFYTSRVFMTYISEGMILLKEGTLPALIENAGRLAGMPVGPLCVADEVGLDLVHHIIRQTEADIGEGFIPPAIKDVIELLVKKLGRIGRKAGKGFYEYPVLSNSTENASKFLLPSLQEYFPPLSVQPQLELVKKRLLYIQSLESVRCLEENILTSARDGDVGSILGWGFPAYTGGTISLIEMVGLSRFVEECKLLEEQYGSRYATPTMLKTLLREGRSFYDETKP